MHLMLLISDLHFTDLKQDEYRWDIFDFVERYRKKTEDKNLLILGDLTDSKDHHSSVLVNRIVQHMRHLVEIGMDVFILKGNHDYSDPNKPFFKFLEQIEYVSFISDPSFWLIEGQKCLFLPHTRNPIEDWKGNKFVKKWKKKCNLVFMHQSVIGSVASNGYLMEKGLDRSYFERFSGQVYSGDIHVPQNICSGSNNIGGVHYVGSPYSIRFNDDFDGRAVALLSYPVGTSGVAIKGCSLLEDELPTDLMHRRTIDINKIEDLNSAKIKEGDQIKIRYHVRHMKRISLQQKQEFKKRCKELGFECCSIVLVKKERFPLRGRRKAKELHKKKSPTRIISEFGKEKGLGKSTVKVGKELVEE